jgi:hypothetical protein
MLCPLDPGRERVIEVEGAITVLVLLSSKEAVKGEVVQHAVQTIAHLGEDEANVPRLVKAGAVAPLLHICEWSTELQVLVPALRWEFLVFGS